jgi:DnaJ-class molecular chaperone
MKTCPDCNGDGVIEKGTDDEQQCPTCGGSGYVPDDDDDNYEEIIKTSACWGLVILAKAGLKKL